MVQVSPQSDYDKGRSTQMPSPALLVLCVCVNELHLRNSSGNAYFFVLYLYTSTVYWVKTICRCWHWTFWQNFTQFTANYSLNSALNSLALDNICCRHFFLHNTIKISPIILLNSKSVRKLNFNLWRANPRMRYRIAYTYYICIAMAIEEKRCQLSYKHYTYVQAIKNEFDWEIGKTFEIASTHLFANIRMHKFRPNSLRW